MAPPRNRRSLSPLRQTCPYNELAADRRPSGPSAPDQPYTQPYWLVRPRVGEAYSVPSQTLVGRPENPPVLEAVFEMNVDGSPIVLRRPVINRYIDRARGELVQPISVVPAAHHQHA